MTLFTLNWWVVPVAVLFSMANGFVWYNPKTFFTPWWKVVGGGKPQPAMESMGPVWALTIVAAAVKAVFVGVAVNAFAPLFGGPTAVTGLVTGAIVWLGVVAPTYLVNKLFAGHGLVIWSIEVGNHLVDFLAYGFLFGLWR